MILLWLEKVYCRTRRRSPRSCSYSRNYSCEYSGENKTKSKRYSSEERGFTKSKEYSFRDPTRSEPVKKEYQEEPVANFYPDNQNYYPQDAQHIEMKYGKEFK